MVAGGLVMGQVDPYLATLLANYSALVVSVKLDQREGGVFVALVYY